MGLPAPLGHIWSLLETLCRNLKRGRSVLTFSAAISMLKIKRMTS